MQILVATDGTLDVDRVTSFVTPWAANGGTVTVMTAVEIPRRLLSDLRSLYGEQAAPAMDSDLEYVGTAGMGHDAVGWPGDSQVIQDYLTQKQQERCGPLLDALTAAGAKASGMVKECADPARAILDEARDGGFDVVVIGAKGEGFFEALLGSTGIKVTRLASCPVLVIHS